MLRRGRGRGWANIDHHDSLSLVDEVEDIGTSSQIPHELGDGQDSSPMANVVDSVPQLDS